MTRLLAALSAAAMVAAHGLVTSPPAHTDPIVCPPDCDRIPATAWVDPAAIPLAGKYNWPNLAHRAVPVQRPRFYFEDVCDIPPAPADPRSYVVAAKATVANPPGQWQLQAQVLHWRGDVWLGGQLADEAVHSAVTALRACQSIETEVSPSITTDQPGRLAAVLTVAGTPTTIVHQYVVSHPQSGTIVELAMWASSPPLQNWRTVPDEQVFDALLAPLCDAYISSCR
ncbi:MAG TPA: ATPase [Mycobacterium sp.]|nr:ATPase [Mycobacterium sp.]